MAKTQLEESVVEAIVTPAYNPEKLKHAANKFIPSACLTERPNFR
jgi:hypothetical protein